MRWGTCGNGLRWSGVGGGGGARGSKDGARVRGEVGWGGGGCKGWGKGG